jgi:hypothetical protein
MTMGMVREWKRREKEKGACRESNSALVPGFMTVLPGD